MKRTLLYGFLFALAIFLWAVIEWLLGLHDRYIHYHEYLSYLFAVPSVAIMYWGIRSGAHGARGGISFGKAFSTGLGITAVVVVLCPLVWYVFCTFVNPALLDEMRQHAEEAKGMDTELAAKRFSLGNHLLLSTLSTAVIGVVISLVVAVVISRQRR